MYKLFTDGGSRGNPGNAATGIFLFDEKDNLVDFQGDYLGVKSNNVAEYTALVDGLKLASKHRVKEIVCHLDSELVVKQLNGEYKVKHHDMQDLYKKVVKLKGEFKSVEFKHVPRAENKFADRMVNIILDSREEI